MIRAEASAQPVERDGQRPRGLAKTPVRVAFGPVTVAHVVDFYNRYPGEKVTFYTCIEVREPTADLTLSVSLPAQFGLGEYRPPLSLAGVLPHIEIDDEAHYLIWSLPGELAAGSRYEYQTEATVTAVPLDMYLASRARVTTGGQEVLAEETVSIAIRTKGKYLRYLPALYEQDEFMSRFVMLFESFWGPIETQIDHIHYYFDPRITPAKFLSWLATWLDLKLDERWPEARLRQLLRWAIALYRSRGTKWGLLKYLEIYTGQQAKIVERRAKNFVLGPEARLGPGIALGRGNVPHTFTVSLRLPALEIEDEGERKRQELIRQRTIESIIEMQKPAHTVYTLDLEIVPLAELTSPVQTADLAASTPETEQEQDEIATYASLWFKLED